MWFLSAFIGYFLLAVAAVTDKFVLSKTKLSAAKFAFLVAAMGGLGSSLLIIIARPFFIPYEHLFLLALAGFGLYTGTYNMFKVISKYEISRVNPIIISLIPLFIALIAFSLQIDKPLPHQIVGGAIVVVSSFLMSQVGLPRLRLERKDLGLLAVAAFGYAAYQSLSKHLYNELPFFVTFIWANWFALIAAIILVPLAKDFKDWFKHDHHKELHKRGQLWPVLLGQTSGALAVLALQYAVKNGSVFLVNALQGAQNFLVLLLTISVSAFMPHIMREDISKKVLLRKFSLSIFLFIGLWLVLK